MKLRPWKENEEEHAEIERRLDEQEEQMRRMMRRVRALQAEAGLYKLREVKES